MRGTRTRSRALLVVAGAAALLMAGTGTAAAKTYTTTIKVDGYYLGYFEGSVKSKQRKCKRSRAIALYVIEAPPAQDELVGEAKTDKRGKWQVNDTHGLGGDYYAIVDEKKIRKNGKRHTCSDAESPAFTR